MKKELINVEKELNLNIKNTRTMSNYFVLAYIVAFLLVFSLFPFYELIIKSLFQDITTSGLYYGVMFIVFIIPIVLSFIIISLVLRKNTIKNNEQNKFLSSIKVLFIIITIFEIVCLLINYIAFLMNDPIQGETINTITHAIWFAMIIIVPLFSNLISYFITKKIAKKHTI